MALPVGNYSAGGGKSDASATGGSAPFDSSGWVVNFGDGSVTSANSGFGQYMPWVAGALAVAALAYAITRRRK